MKPELNEQLPEPDLTGVARAWKYRLGAIEQKLRAADKWRPHGTLVSWLIEVKWANPMWHSYVLHLYHLRKLEGVTGENKIYLAGATHEIVLFALDPDKARDVEWLPAHLLPANFAAQMVCDSDEAALLRVGQAVVEICAGQLSPDTDHTQSWIARFGSNMVKGDPARAGETVVTLVQGDRVEKMVIDPKKATEAPDLNKSEI